MKFLLSAGEASGDTYGAQLIDALRRLVPGAAFFGMGGENLRQKLDRIHDVLKQHVADGKLPGTVVLVARKGKLVYANAAGFQDKDEGKPMALDSLFRIYSMTKPLVSVAAMMLVEDGTIQLTDPVSKFFAAFKGQQVSVAKSDTALARMSYALVAADREMTVQDILRHTAECGSS